MADKERKLHLDTLDELDRPLNIITIHSWILVTFVVLLVASVIAWSIMGTIPVTVEGKCFIFDPTSSKTVRSSISGTVSRIDVSTGDAVKEGQVIGALEDGGEVLIRSPINGKVTWIDVTRGESVFPSQPILYIEGPLFPGHIEIYGFLSLSAGEQVQPGMDVKCAIEGVDTQRYGMIQARIKEILPYPVSSKEAMMQKIPSDTLREYLISGPLPTILVVAEPILTTTTPSGMEWTSNEGPPSQIEPGSIGMMRIILSHMRPIQYFIPSIR